MAEKNSKDNIFEIEKLYSESGIYIIYNKNKKTAYIGQAKDMKERMRQHLDALYSNKIKRVFIKKICCANSTVKIITICIDALIK